MEAAILSKNERGTDRGAVSKYYWDYTTKPPHNKRRVMIFGTASMTVLPVANDLDHIAELAQVEFAGGQERDFVHLEEIQR